MAREWAHHVLVEGKGFICHKDKDMWLVSSRLCSKQGPVRWQIEGATENPRTDSGVGQDVAIARSAEAPTNHPELPGSITAKRMMKTSSSMGE